VLWNQGLRDIADTHIDSIDDSAGLFALANLAMADSGSPVPDHVLSHLSPLGWEHITFTGLYYWRRHFRSDPEALRSLRPFKLPLAKAKTA